MWRQKVDFSKASRPVAESTQTLFQVSTSSRGKIRENLFAVNRTVRGRTPWTVCSPSQIKKVRQGSVSGRNSNKLDLSVEVLNQTYYRRKNIYIRPSS